MRLLLGVVAEVAVDDVAADEAVDIAAVAIVAADILGDAAAVVDGGIDVLDAEDVHQGPESTIVAPFVSLLPVAYVLRQPSVQLPVCVVPLRDAVVARLLVAGHIAVGPRGLLVGAVFVLLRQPCVVPPLQQLSAAVLLRKLYDELPLLPLCAELPVQQRLLHEKLPLLVGVALPLPCGAAFPPFVGFAFEVLHDELVFRHLLEFL